MKKSDYPNYQNLVGGFGIGYRPPHYQQIIEEKPAVDFLEIVSENFMNNGRRPEKFLEKIRELYPICMHGVSLSIGSTDPLNQNYVDDLKKLCDFVQPRLVSDHLCWTAHQNHNSHDLLPAPYTLESLKTIIRKLDEVQDRLGRQILLENPSLYASFAKPEMSEAEFYQELCRATGCGILLDINNVYVNSRNVGLDPYRYLNELPASAVGYFHLAGHSEEDGVVIDTHDHPVRSEVWDLYRHAARRWPTVSTLVEWDDKIPDLNRLLEEANTARDQRAYALREDKQIELTSDTQPTKSAGGIHERLSQLQSEFLRGISSRTNEDLGLAISWLSTDNPVSAERGAAVYQNAYFTRLTDFLISTFPSLYFIMEEEGFAITAQEFFAAYPPSHPSANWVGDKFAEFLALGTYTYDFGVDPKILAAIAHYEWTKAEVFMHPDRSEPADIRVLADLSPDNIPDLRLKFCEALRVLTFDWPIGDICAAIEAGETPAPPEFQPSAYLIARSGTDLRLENLSFTEAHILNNLIAGQSFSDSLPETAEAEYENVIQQGTELIVKCLGLGLVTKLSYAPVETSSFNSL